MKIFNFFILSVLTGCGPYRIINSDLYSGSPCIDGTILNLYQSGCESFYWGFISNSDILKIRCTYSKKDLKLTSYSFYAIKNSIDKKYKNSSIYCQDNYVTVHKEYYEDR